jgi:hypothetical protein
MRVKYRSTDEILSEDLDSVTPVDVGGAGGGGARNAKDSSSTSLNLYKRLTNRILSEDPGSRMTVRCEEEMSALS